MKRFSDHKRIHTLVLWGLLVTATTAKGATADNEASALTAVEKRIMSAWKLPPKSDGLKVTLRY